MEYDIRVQYRERENRYELTIMGGIYKGLSADGNTLTDAMRNLMKGIDVMDNFRSLRIIKT